MAGGVLRWPGDGNRPRFDIRHLEPRRRLVGRLNVDAAVTSTISAQDVALTESGGTIFNVAPAASQSISGVDLDVTGTFYHSSSSADNGLIKAGTGVMRLDGNNTYTSATTLNLGTLLLNATSNAAINSGASANGSGSVLTLAGETLSDIGASSATQYFNSTTVSPGGSVLTTSGTIGHVVASGAFTRSVAGGTVDFPPLSITGGAAGSITTTTADAEPHERSANHSRRLGCVRNRRRLADDVGHVGTGAGPFTIAGLATYSTAGGIIVRLRQGRRSQSHPDDRREHHDDQLLAIQHRRQQRLC